MALEIIVNWDICKDKSMNSFVRQAQLGMSDSNMEAFGGVSQLRTQCLGSTGTNATQPRLQFIEQDELEAASAFCNKVMNTDLEIIYT